MKLYLSCALTDAPPDFLESVERLRGTLERQTKFEILKFLGTATGTPKDVYKRDIKECVETCDVMLAVCDYGATGLGYEMATAIEARNISVLAVAGRARRVSRLIEGIQHPLFSFRRYELMSRDIPRLLEEHVEFMLEATHQSPRGIRRR